MIEDKIKNKYRKLLPILPGLLTPSEVASEIVRPEIGLQVNRGSIPGLQKHNNINIHEIGGDTAWKPNSHDHYNNQVNNHESHTSYLEERVMHLEQSNQRLSQALYSLSSRDEMKQLTTRLMKIEQNMSENDKSNTFTDQRLLSTTSNLKNIVDNNSSEISLSLQQLQELKSTYDVSQLDNQRQFKILLDRCRNIEEHSSQTIAHNSVQPMTLGSSPFLEQSVRDLQTRTKTLGEQLNSLQSVSSSVSPIVKNDIFQLNQRLDQLYKSTNQNQRELDNVKQSVNENSAKSKIEKMEIEQNSGMNLKQFEQQVMAVVNNIENQNQNHEQLLKRDVTHKILDMEQSLGMKIEEVSSGANQAKHEMINRLDLDRIKLEEKIGNLQNTITIEKHQISSVLQQNEVANREMERLLKINYKDFETLLLAEITKREKNSRMVLELDRSVQDICREIDSRFDHQDKKQLSIISKIKNEIKTALIQEHKAIASQIDSHDNELTSLNSMLTEKYEELTKKYNENYRKNHEIFGKFDKEMSEKFKIFHKFESNLKEASTGINNIDEKITEIDGQIIELKELETNDFSKLQTELGNIRVSTRTAEQQLKSVNQEIFEINGMMKNFEEEREALENGVQAEFERIDAEKVVSVGFEEKNEYKEMVFQIDSLKERVDNLHDVIRLDGRRVKEVITAVIAESQSDMTSADVTGLEQSEENASLTGNEIVKVESSNSMMIRVSKSILSQASVRVSKSVSNQEKPVRKKYFIRDADRPFESELKINTWGIYNALLWMKLKNKWRNHRRELDILDIDSMKSGQP